DAADAEHQSLGLLSIPTASVALACIPYQWSLSVHLWLICPLLSIRTQSSPKTLGASMGESVRY
ncbi:hypothetical protein ACD584_18140, partial [Xanthomonas sp. NCPPB 2922]|uniref:hypothetical protein n=1 Tax=Xanthomonas TaxID=338 RepID=UPI0029C493ED